MLKQIQAAVNDAASAVSGGAVGELAVCAAPLGKGDLAISLSALTRALKVAPSVVGPAIAERMRKLPFVKSVDEVGPFVNITMLRDWTFASAFAVVREKQVSVSKPQRIMVEYLSPNTNKPLHVGHVRNGVLGSTLARLLAEVGHTVIRANLVNDRGEHICKSMLAYRLFGKGTKPSSTGQKGDHFVGEMYVRYAEESKKDPTLEGRVRDMLRLWEDGDVKTRALWDTMNRWVLDGFAVTNARYGFEFDKVYFESELYLLGKDIVHDGLARGIFEKDEVGAIRFTLDPKLFGNARDDKPRRPKVLNEDGTSVYMTQDLGTAVLKAQEFMLDRSIYVVADEQNQHFKSLFAILGALGYAWAGKCHHLSYGMVNLPSGRMKSREGTVVDADDLADEMQRAAAATIRERDPSISEDEVAARAEVIALAAIKFYLARFSATTTVSFDPEKSLSFEGDTGPYCLYTYARTQSILSKAGIAPATVSFDRLGTDDERACALELLFFPEGVQKAADMYAPSILADRMLSLARAFNRFYKNNPVIGDDADLTRERLALVESVAEALRWGFRLLGITPLERM